MIYQRLLSFCAITLLLAMLPNWAMAQDAKNGKSLFLDKCASCHNIDMVSDMTGPALFGAQDRWAEYPGAIYEWVRNSVDLAAAGNPRAMTMIDWDASEMTAFGDLENEQIDDILAFVQVKGEFGCVSPPCETAVATSDAGGTTSEPTSPYLGYTLLAVLLIAVALLGRYINSLTRLSQQKAGTKVIAEKSVVGVLFSVIRALLVIVGFFPDVDGLVPRRQAGADRSGFRGGGREGRARRDLSAAGHADRRAAGDHAPEREGPDRAPGAPRRI